MRYYVFGSDERMYGPEDVATIQAWAKEGRLSPSTKLRDADSGEETTWAQVDPSGAPPVVAASPAYSVPGTPYPRNGYQTAPQAAGAMSSAATNGYFVWALIDAIGAIVLFFVFRGIGIIFAAYGIYNGYRAFAGGHKYGWLAIGAAVVAFVAVGLGWLLRLGGAR